MDYEAVLKKSLFDWMRERKLLKQAALIWVVQFVWFLIFMVASFLAFSLFFVSQLSAAQNGFLQEQRLPEFLESFLSSLTSNPGLLWSFIVAAIVWSVLTALIFFVIMSFIRANVLHETLVWQQQSPAPISNNKRLQFAVFGIYMWLYIFLLLKDPKWLAIPAAALLLTIGAFTSPLLILLAIIGWIAYLVVATYHSVRLFVAPALWIRKDMNMGHALDVAWQSSKGRALSIFIVYILFAIVVGIIGSAFGGIGTFWMATVDKPDFNLAFFAIGMLVYTLTIYAITAYSILGQSVLETEILRELESTQS